MGKEPKTVETAIVRINTIRLPQAFLEEAVYSDGQGGHAQRTGKKDWVNVTYGKNYSCVVVVCKGAKLGSLTIERINKLVSEPLDTNR